MSGPLVVIGDCLLDVDVDGRVERLSPEAPVPVLDVEREWRRPGGAGLTAILAARDHPDVVLVTALALDADGDVLRSMLSEFCTPIGLKLDGGTVTKTRVRAPTQPLLRIDAGDGRAADGPLPAAARDAIAAAAAVVVADYGRGVAALPEMRRLLAQVAEHAPVVWDPHPRGRAPAPGVRLATPNLPEAEKVVAEHAVAEPGLTRADLAEAVRRRWRSRAAAVTTGADGAWLAQHGAAPQHFPPPHIAGEARTDTCGAGDSFSAAAGAVLARGGSAESAVRFAVARAARFVAGGGAGSMSESCFGGAGSAGLRRARSAVRDGNGLRGGREADAVAMTERVRSAGGTLVATGGCFDLLHPGHARLLTQARALGDALVVCLNSDASVRRLKGPGRPIVRQEDRARMLEGLGAVDGVFVFDEETPASALRRLRPDIWVKGGDYTEEDLPEADFVRESGGRIVILPTVPGYSTSRLVAAASRPAAAGEEEK